MGGKEGAQILDLIRDLEARGNVSVIIIARDLDGRRIPHLARGGASANVTHRHAQVPAPPHVPMAASEPGPCHFGLKGGAGVRRHPL
jgi:hypothetical protein